MTPTGTAYCAKCRKDTEHSVDLVADTAVCQVCKVLLQAIMPKPRNHPENKYHARRTEYNGRFYASKAEANYAWHCDLAKKVGRVQFWLRQVPFDIPGHSRYYLDFMVFEPEGKVIFVEVKGKDLPMGKLKRQQVEELYGIEVKLVK